MRVDPTQMAGVQVLQTTRFADSRGTFTKIVPAPDLALTADVSLQVCTSSNTEAGTLRGMHLQTARSPETKLVACVAGSVFDVLVDARLESPTYGSWAAITLEADRPLALRIPPGVAHGYLTTTDDTVVVYMIEGQHDPSAAETLAWDDPTVAISWPRRPSVISDRDRAAASWPITF